MEGRKKECIVLWIRLVGFFGFAAVAAYEFFLSKNYVAAIILAFIAVCFIVDSHPKVEQSNGPMDELPF